MKKIILLVTLFSFSISFAQEGKNAAQEKIIEEFLINCAQRYNYNTRMSDWQNCLDNGLAKDSTIAYLWQQKAMPYLKQENMKLECHFLTKL